MERDAAKPFGKGVQSIEVGFSLIRAMMRAETPLPLKQLAADAGMTPSKAHNYLVSFRNIGLVAQEPRHGRYELGALAVELGIAALARQGPLQIADRAIHALRGKRPRVSIFVSIWSSAGPVIVARGEGNDAVIPFEIRVGYHSSLLHTATGRAFLAYLPRAMAAELMAAEFTAPPPGAPAIDDVAIEAELLRIHADGFAVVANRLLPGLAGVAVPIFDHQGQLGAVLTAITRSDEEPSLDNLIADMTEAVTEFRIGES